MTVSVVGLNELDEMALELFDVIFSLIDPRDEKTELRVKEALEKGSFKGKHIVFFFDDLTDEEHPDSPTLDHVELLLMAFTEMDLSEKNVLIHCHGGVSRSTAAGILLLITQKKMAIPEAFELMKLKRPMMWPNDLMIRFADELLAFEGELCKFDKQWKEENLDFFWKRPPIRVKTLDK